MNRKRPSLLFLIPLLLSAAALPGEELTLVGGSRIQGKVVKRTAEFVFVDIGYTILSIPGKEVEMIRAPEEDREKPAGGEEGGRPGGEKRHGIYFTGTMEPGSIKEKAREVAEGVVQVICPAKLGSGFIINDEERYVVTNAHVVEGDQNIAVVIYVKEENSFRKIRLDRVKIVAINPFFDLALLQVEEPREKKEASIRFQKVYLGDSEAVRMGDPVFAVGSPLGLERTVTEGIVSNARRARRGLIYIQTSAPINPGNSGGPLFNNRGEVIGITSLKVVMGESLGFAIPVNYLKDFLVNREAFSFDKENANNGIRYLRPPRKKAPEGQDF